MRCTLAQHCRSTFELLYYLPTFLLFLELVLLHLPGCWRIVEHWEAEALDKLLPSDKQEAAHQEK